MKISLHKLEEYCPRNSCIWRVDPYISFPEIKERLDNNQFEQEPFFKNFLETPLNKNRERHIRRIAYLAKFGWEDPIDIDIGIPNWTLPSWVIQDGNHRYVASLFLDYDWIEAECSGDIDLIEELRFEEWKQQEKSSFMI